MSQFDVHRNPGPNAAKIPFVVVVQSSIFDERRSRIVIPLWSSKAAREEVHLPASKVNPIFTVDGMRVILHTLQIVSVPLSALGKKVGSLAEEGDAIVAAMDEVFSRAYK